MGTWQHAWCECIGTCWDACDLVWMHCKLLWCMVTRYASIYPNSQAYTLVPKHICKLWSMCASSHAFKLRIRAVRSISSRSYHGMIASQVSSCWLNRNCNTRNRVHTQAETRPANVTACHFFAWERQLRRCRNNNIDCSLSAFSVYLDTQKREECERKSHLTASGVRNSRLPIILFRSDMWFLWTAWAFYQHTIRIIFFWQVPGNTK